MVNLFWLSPPRYVRGRGLNYSWCARQHIDAHIIKIPLEAAQLLYAAHHALPAADDWRTRAPMAGTGERGYRPTHMNNPLSKWLRESAAHYRHAVAYGLALCEEYSHRYGREHACEAHLHWLKGHEPAIPYVDDHPDDHGEDNEVARFRIARAPPCAMPDEFKVAPAEESAANAAEAKEEPDEADALSSVAEGDGETATRPLKGSKDKEKVATIKTEKDEEADGDRDDDDDDDARRIIAEAELAKRQRREKEEAEEEEEEEEEVEVKTMKVEVELQTTGGDVALIKTETSEETTTTTTTTTTAVSSEAVDDEEERVEDLLRPIEDEVAASEVAFPLHVYQSYRAYYLGQKLSLKMSTFKTRDIPHWAQERVLEIRAQPKPAPVKKEKKTTTTTRTRRTTTTTTTTTVAKRKRGQAAKATEAGEEENEDEAAGDEDYTEGRRTLSRTRKAAQVEQEQDEGEKKKKKTKRTKKNHDDGGDEGQDKGEQEKKRKTSDQLDGGGAVPRRSPRTSKARSTTSTSSADTALSKRRKVAKEIK